MADQLPTPADSPQVIVPEPSFTTTTSTTTATTTSVSTEDHLAQGIRFLALSKYSQASESLSYAVESLTEKNGELSIENVDALILYGKALLGNAIEQSAVLGDSNQIPGTSTTAAAGEEAGPSTSSNATAGPSTFHFGGDGDDDEDEEHEQEEEGEEEKEDDFESAFVALDLARRSIELEVDRLEQELKNLSTTSQQEKQKELEKERIEKKEKLAQVHRLLGDVATESEQFENAVEEYSSSLSILTKLRQPSDRLLSEQHMLIALALEFIPNQLNRSISHAEKSKSVLVLRLKELETKVQSGGGGEGDGDKENNEKDLREIKDLKELIKDVDDKIEDLKTVPTAPAPSTADLALQDYLRQAALGSSSSSSSSLPVNDLNSLVKKKKKQPTTTTTLEVEEESNGKGKRKAEDSREGQEEEEKIEEKKLKID